MGEENGKLNSPSFSYQLISIGLQGSALLGWDGMRNGCQKSVEVSCKKSIDSDQSGDPGEE